MLAIARLACVLGLRTALPRAAVRCKSAYEGEGKTTVNILNKDTEVGIMIDSFSSQGFRLNNGVTILGSMVLFPRTVLSWQVKSAEDITPESLRLLTLLDPKIDLVVIGLEIHKNELVQPVLRIAKELKLNVEVLDTEHACATFNFLTAEGRSVAAALIPPLHVNATDDDIVSHRMHHEDNFNKDLLG